MLETKCFSGMIEMLAMWLPTLSRQHHDVTNTVAHFVVSMGHFRVKFKHFICYVLFIRRYFFNLNKFSDVFEHDSKK